MSQALLVIDVQKDYFEDGKFPLWKAEETLDRIEGAMGRARAKGLPIILVQHVVDPAEGPAPFFEKGTEGASIHPRIVAAAPDAPVVVKTHADSFVETNLEEELAKREIDDLLVCGMMTHNCVTHTSLSKAAEKYKVAVLADCCTTVSEMIHTLSLHALTDRLPVRSSDEAI